MAAPPVSKNQIKYLQSLKLKKYRQKYDSFIVEGRKVVGEALQGKFLKIKALYATLQWISDPKNKTDTQNIPVYLLSEPLLKKVSSLVTPDQVMAECAIPPFKAPQADGTGWIIFLDAISDPGNLGTIIRTADWFGVNQLVLAPGTADCYNPKCVQASMGSVTGMSLAYLNFQALLEYLPQHPIYIATMLGTSAAKLINPQPGILVIGSESHGISEEILQYPHRKISIPKAPSSQAESLNAAMATTALLSLLTLSRL